MVSLSKEKKAKDSGFSGEKKQKILFNISNVILDFLFYFCFQNTILSPVRTRGLLSLAGTRDPSLGLVTC